MKSFCRCVLTLPLLAALWTAHYGYAEETPPDKDATEDAGAQEPAIENGDKKPAPPDKRDVKRLKEVTITAHKGERIRSEMPGEVGVVTHEELQNRQADDLEDIVKYEPGTETARGPRRIGQRPNIRGLDGPRTLVTLDGARMNFDSGHKGQIFVDPDFVNRAEVIRGPASSLYGSGAIGGSLNLRTIEPSDYLDPGEWIGFQAKAGFEAVDDEWTISPAFFGRAGRDGDGAKFEYLLKYTARRADDYEIGDIAGNLPHSGDSVDSGLAKLVGRPTDRDTLTFSTMVFNDDQTVPANTETADTAAALLNDRVTRQTTYNLRYRHDDPDRELFNLEATAYRTEMDIEERRVSDGRLDLIDYTTMGFDVRNSSRFDWGAHELILTGGLELFCDEQEGERASNPSLFFPNASAMQIAPYVQLELSAFDNLFKLVPGVRWDNYSMDSDFGETHEDRLSPKVGAVVQLDDELGLRDGNFLALHANYTHGFRAPTFGELFIGGPHFFVPGFGGAPNTAASFEPNPNLKPETSWNVDAGLRLKYDKVRFSATYFENHVSNFIGTRVEGGFIPPPPPPGTVTLDFIFENLSSVLIRGAEFEAEWEFYKDFRLWANYTQIRGRDLVDDDNLSTIPADKTVVGLDYYNRTYGLFAGLRMRNYAAQHRVPKDDSGAPEVPPSTGYAIFDAMVSWVPEGPKYPDWIKGLRVDLGVDNFTDRKYTPYFQGVPSPGINPKASISYTRKW